MVGGGATAFALLRGGGGAPPEPSPPPPPTTRAERPTPTPSPTYDPRAIRNTSVDPKPLTLREAFPDQRITLGEVTFQRVATDLVKDCAEASQSGLDPALQQANCLRVLRATFVDQDKEYAVTIGIAVLPNAAGAQQLADALVPQENIWFSGLPGPQGSGAAQIDESGGWSKSAAIGHYVAFSFATYTDTTTPPSDYQELRNLSRAMLAYVQQPILKRGLVTPSPPS